MTTGRSVEGDSIGAARQNKRTPRFRQRAWLLVLLVRIAASLLCALTIIAYLGRSSWVFDVFSHFRVQYFLGLAVCLVVFALARDRLSLVFAGACLVVNAVEIAPWYVGGERAATGDEAACLKVLSANVNSRNREHDRLVDLVRDADPDVIVVLEASSPWADALEAIAEEYPHTVAKIREDNFGIAVYSRVPFINAKIVTYGSAGVPSVVATLELGGKEVTLLATHPLPPRNGVYWKLRNEQLEAIAAAREALGDRLIVAADLNASPFSPCTKHFVSAMGMPEVRLRFASRGHGYRPTWPTFMWPLATVLDHILVTDNLAVTEFRTGPNIGSDHLPLRATIALGE